MLSKDKSFWVAPKAQQEKQGCAAIIKHLFAENYLEVLIGKAPRIMMLFGFGLSA